MVKAIPIMKKDIQKISKKKFPNRIPEEIKSPVFSGFYMDVALI